MAPLVLVRSLSLIGIRISLRKIFLVGDVWLANDQIFNILSKLFPRQIESFAVHYLTLKRHTNGNHSEQIRVRVNDLNLSKRDRSTELNLRDE